MMKSYVINLANRPERLAHVRKTFGDAGIPFERFEAIGRDQLADYDLSSRLRPRGDGRPWLPMEVGCLLSHRELWKRVATGGDDFAAIFEDDIIVSSGLRDILGGDLPPGADLVKLETFCQVTYVSRRAIPRRNGSGCFRRLLTIHEGTGAYVISRHAAAKLIDAAAQFDQPLDRSMFCPRVLAKEGLIAYQAVPGVAIQGMFLSGLRDSPAMQSDRNEDLKLAPIASPKLNIFDRAARVIQRLARQVRGTRTIIPFEQ